jgi:hypothetical protein
MAARPKPKENASPDLIGHRTAVGATASRGGFLHNGLVDIDKSHPPAPESTLRDSCLGLSTCRNSAAIRRLPGVVIRSLSERSTMYPSAVSRA